MLPFPANIGSSSLLGNLEYQCLTKCCLTHFRCNKSKYRYSNVEEGSIAWQIANKKQLVWHMSLPPKQQLGTNSLPDQVISAKVLGREALHARGMLTAHGAMWHDDNSSSSFSHHYLRQIARTKSSTPEASSSSQLFWLPNSYFIPVWPIMSSIKTSFLHFTDFFQNISLSYSQYHFSFTVSTSDNWGTTKNKILQA